MILVVDDDPKFLAQAEEAFGKYERVFFAANAVHALELIGSVGAHFSVALIDLDLRATSGFEVIALVRGRFPDLPVIAISSTSHRATLESAKEFGATDILSKPITEEWHHALARIRGRAASNDM